jgi:hypothetical protein
MAKRYPKRGDVVILAGHLRSFDRYPDDSTCPDHRHCWLMEPTPAIVVQGGPNGSALVEVPLLKRFWANLSQISYPEEAHHG